MELGSQIYVLKSCGGSDKYMSIQCKQKSLSRNNIYEALRPVEIIGSIELIPN